MPLLRQSSRGVAYSSELSDPHWSPSEELLIKNISKDRVVFKKSSPNGKVTTYLGKRDFIDYGTHTDPVDGVVLIDTEYLNTRKVFVNIVAAFRYGREDLDVLGLTFRKDLLVSTVQVYPPITPPEGKRELSRLQERLIKKLGEHAYPFYFEIPGNAPASVTLQPAQEDTGKPCGVDYELKTYVADSDQEKSHKRNSVRLAIRKLTYAPSQPAPQPSTELIKEFMMSSGKLKLEASLDKEKYYHGEKIAVNVTIDNGTSKTIKKIKISAVQNCELAMYTVCSYNSHLSVVEEGFPVQPSQTGFCKVYELCPTLDSNRDKRGLALDGKLKHEDTNLASSTIITDPSLRENLGIVVQYKVKVRLILGTIIPSNDVSVELPFTLTHPKPLSPQPSLSSLKHPSGGAAAGVGAGGEGHTIPAEPQEPIKDEDTDLIQLEETLEAPDEDFIFEDFARLRLKGLDLEDTDA